MVATTIAMRLFWVYILRCADGSYYTGVTGNLDQRLYLHQQGIVKTSYTYLRRPVVLVYAEYTDDVIAAITREKQIQRWTRRKKEALIEGRTNDLPRLSHPSTSSGWHVFVRLSLSKPYSAFAFSSVFYCARIEIWILHYFSSSFSLSPCWRSLLSFFCDFPQLAGWWWN